MAALRLCHVLDLGRADPELERGVAVPPLGALRHHLAIVDAQHGHRDVVALAGEHPGHPELLRDQTGPHYHPLPTLVIASAATQSRADRDSWSARLLRRLTAPRNDVPFIA